jgi:hypothetical protein
MPGMRKTAISCAEMRVELELEMLSQKLSQITMPLQNF